ncbi:uncharacterized protein LOC115619991 [Scaptodrosophila lebanonensis]|uniref:Uncharacterized protein LOC115619991 n=1 Tax=Drosophila lebanonensis TaxID=7225 RepID=A0A6J2SYD0_DROLE|nr:uncharacterized protein LOC115619991 [Scaptodrosophila lebanonensis]
MDKLKNNNNKENAVIASIEYPYPATTDNDDVESNKSTPYYTPLEFLQTSFEFPSPTSETSAATDAVLPPTQQQRRSNEYSGGGEGVFDVAYTQQNASLERIDTYALEKEDTARAYTPKQFTIATPKQPQPQPNSQSPTLNRKFKRFSLYDRRSCSPHIATRNATTATTSTTVTSGLSLDERGTGLTTFANKENTIPKTGTGTHTENEQDILYMSKSEHNSPTILFKDETSTPNPNLSYSPKLLASINNLNLSGSPLNIINSAGYKNGNFFRFPEIDHVVQEAIPLIAASTIEDPHASYCDNQMHIRTKFASTSPSALCHATVQQQQRIRKRSTSSDIMESTSTQTSELSQEQSLLQPEAQLEEQQKCEGRKNRKNKNNLTIRITDVPIKSSTQISPLPKPKTPTIKSTKEKARSLDSAANEGELSIVVHNITESHGSCDVMDTQMPTSGSTSQLQANMLMQPASNIHSTSLSRLDTHSNLVNRRTSRRKSPGLNNSDWLMYHRKHNPYQVPHTVKLQDCSSSTAQSSLDSDVMEYSGSDSPQRSAAELKSASSVDSSNTKFGLGATLAPRNAHKHNQLLHSSSTNLKTLPESLTLVEFSLCGGPSPKESPSPYKQKSMDLPVSAHAAHTNLQAMQTKSTVSTSSMNLLQRRGSIHSLTLNLHSSCGNLVNNSLSVSNYSLGSMGNFNTILNSKSSCNLDINAARIAGAQLPGQQHTLNATGVPIISNQGTRQGLFRRRGSNHSITLKAHTTTSCGDLNSISTQQTLSADKYRLSTRTNSTGSSTHTNSNVPTPKRGLLERRGSNQSLTLNMGGIMGSSNQHLGDIQMQDVSEQPKVSACSCAAAQAPHQRKFYSTENLNTNRGNQQFFDFDTKQACFGSASNLQPSEQSTIMTNTQEAIMCTCTGGVRNIMTRPLSPQTTSEEFKIYLASIQMLQSASNPLNQFDLIKLNYVFDNSYKTNRNIIERPPVLGANGRDGDTPTNQLPPTSEDSELLTSYQAVVKRIITPIPQLAEEEQKRIFRDLHKEFWDLPLNHQEKPMVFGSQTKNRYKTILPNEHSRVLVDSEAIELLNLQQQSCLGMGSESATEDIKKSSLLAYDEVPYINANYIKGPDYVSKCYVATQGPMPNTIFEFWLMVYQNTQRYIRRCVDGGSSSSPHVDKSHILQQYFQKIVMLTNFTESSRQKCAIYFPIEFNEIFAVAAKGEVFELSTSAKEYFDAHLLPSTVVDNPVGLNELEISSRHISIDSKKVSLSVEVRDTLPKNSNFFLAKNVGIVRRNGYSIRKLVLLYCINVPQSAGQLDYYLQKICCYHYWYPDWPDHHSPRDINTLLDTCLHVLNLGKCESEFDNYDDKRSMCNAHLSAQRLEIYKQDIFNAVQPLPIIHCSAGIGRTGCFTAILNAVRQVRQSLAYSLTGMLTKTLTTADSPPIAAEARDDADTDIDSSFTCNTILHIRHIVDSLVVTSATAATTTTAPNLKPPATFEKLPKMPDIFVDILGIVCNLRLQRGGMVQNSEQYELIHRAICLYLKRTLALRRF